jgi:hypothetical protein
MPLDDFMAAFDKFNQGLRDVSTFNAINEANETVKTIKGAQMKDFEQRQAISGVANDLAARLGSFGVDPRAAGQYGQNMMPVAAPAAGSATEAVLNPGQFSNETVAKGQSMLDADAGFRREQLNLQKQSIQARQQELDLKRTEARDKLMGDHVTKFMSAPDVKPVVESLTQLNNMKTALTTRSNTGFSMAVSGMIRAGGDSRINEDDIKRSTPDKSLARSAANYLNGLTEGKPVEADFKVLEVVAKAMETSQKRAMSTAVRRYAAAQGGLKGIPESEFIDRLSKRVGDVNSVTAAPGATATPASTAPAGAAASLNKYWK